MKSSFLRYFSAFMMGAILVLVITVFIELNSFQKGYEKGHQDTMHILGGVHDF